MTERKKPGRPAGSKNKPKTNGGLKGSGVPNGGVGHNGGPPELTDNEQRALMMDHARKVRTIDDEIAVKREERKKLIGAAKNDGIPAKDIKLFLDIQDKSEKDIRADQEKVLQFARWNGLGVQTDLLDYLKKQPAVEERAYAAGKIAASEGEEARAPAEFVGRASSRWLEGHADYHADLQSALAKRRQEEADAPDPFKADDDEHPDPDATNAVPLKGAEGAGEGATA